MTSEMPALHYTLHSSVIRNSLSEEGRIDGEKDEIWDASEREYTYNYGLASFSDFFLLLN